MNLVEFGVTFRNARVAANLTQQAVATKSGVSRHRISLFETGSLPEIGAVRMLSLFDAVGLDLIARPRAAQPSAEEAHHGARGDMPAPLRKRVRPKAPETVTTALEA